MMTFLIILVVLFLVWPMIRRWVQQFMMRRFEDTLRRAMGQPTRREEEKMRRRSRSRGDETARGRQGRRGAAMSIRPAALMKEVAEDAEYTEIREFGERETSCASAGSQDYFSRETQVSDAEYVEIKN